MRLRCQVIKQDSRQVSHRKVRDLFIYMQMYLVRSASAAAYAFLRQTGAMTTDV
jgi:hypothetical protein